MALDLSFKTKMVFTQQKKGMSYHQLYDFSEIELQISIC